MKPHRMLVGLLMILCFISCESGETEFGQGNLTIRIEPGRAWLHDFPLFLGITKKNPPQIAVWLEDLQGNYLSTVYVSRKIATQGWRMAKGDRRKEALPHWCHARGVVYDDGLYLPTRERPVVDGVSGATPRGRFEVRKPIGELKRFVVKVEVNHSTDFNDRYPRHAQAGEAGYSGGRTGSGQPAIVYRAEVDLERGETAFEAVRIGHSSPDGGDGDIHTDLSGLTTALEIVERITVYIQDGK